MIVFPRSIIKTEPDDDNSRDANSVEIEMDNVDEPSLIPKNIIKIEIEEKNETSSSSSTCRATSSLSPNKINSPTPTNVVKVNSTSPQIESPNGSKYCSNCDISFTYTHTFIAHKKFYCKGKQGDGGSTNDSSNVSAVNVTLSAET